MRRILAGTVLFVCVVADAPCETAINRSSRPVRLLRTWSEPVKTADGDVYRRVELLYDYGRAHASENTYDAAGRLILRRRIVVNPPPPTQEEIQEAFEIVRADPELARAIARFSAELEGGFLIEEGRGRACGPGARCLLIQILSPDHSGSIRVVGVDLVKRAIPYRFFVPAEHPGVK